MRPFLAPPPGPSSAAEREPAVRALLTAYRSAAHLGRGLLAWLGLAAAGFMTVFGVASLVEAAAGLGIGSSSALIGAVLLVIGVPLGVWCGTVGRDVVAAGRAISTAAEAWLLSGPGARDTFTNRALALASPLIPELLPRMVLSSLGALGAVLALCGVGYGVWQATMETGSDLVLACAFTAYSLVLAVLCGWVGVALWHSVGRVQRGWVHAREVPRGPTAGDW